MISAEALVADLFELGYGPFLSVPCSILEPICREIEYRDPHNFQYLSNEGEAVAVAVGYWLAGKKPVVLMQNSGLGNALNPLTSLSQTMAVPILLIVSWRGKPGMADEPQHSLMGSATIGVLSEIGIPHFELGRDVPTRTSAAKWLVELGQGQPQTAALLIPQGEVEHLSVPEQKPLGPHPMSRADAIELVVSTFQGQKHVIVCTTGKASRELESKHDQDANLYMVGSMGCAPSIGLGIAMGNPSQRVIVLDGDGALMMRLEAMIAIGRSRPPNLLHIVLDNASHDSTGGQPTGSTNVDFAAIAIACGYRSATDVSSSADLSAHLEENLSQPECSFIRVRVSSCTDPHLRRPSVGPIENAARFRRKLTK